MSLPAELGTMSGNSSFLPPLSLGWPGSLLGQDTECRAPAGQEGCLCPHSDLPVKTMLGTATTVSCGLSHVPQAAFLGQVCGDTRHYMTFVLYQPCPTPSKTTGTSTTPAFPLSTSLELDTTCSLYTRDPYGAWELSYPWAGS